MEASPPFKRLQRPRVLDPLEARQTKIMDPRWVSLFMARIQERDAFHSAKKNLTGPGSGSPTAPTVDCGGCRGDPEKPPRKPPNGGGKGGNKDKEKETAK